MAKNGLPPDLYKRLLAEGRITESLRRRSPILGKRDVIHNMPALELPVEFHLPMPPSTNKLWCTVKDKVNGANIRVLSADAKRWRRNAALFMPKGAMPVEPNCLELRLIVFVRCFHADGTTRQVDVTNRVKFLEDCVADALHYNDRRHWRVVVEKRDAKQEGVSVTLSAFTA